MSNKSKVKKLPSTGRRLRISMIIVYILLLLLIIRIFWIQFVQGAWLKEQMYGQLITSRVISPKRGTIYDSNGKELAISAAVDTVSVNPLLIISKDSNSDVQELKTKALKEKMAKAFSEIFDLDYDKTLEKLNSSNSVETIARKVEKDKIDKLRAWMKSEDVYSGINIDEDTRRYYPFENLASNLIGFCGDDNQGLEGLEAEWDSVLTGTPGRVTTSQDAIQDFIPDRNETYIPASNGNDLTLTIDANIQSICEKYLEQACKENKCLLGGNVIMMNPSTGDILAMATYPNYNLNTPFTVESISEDKWAKMSSDEKYDALYKMWKNKATVDTYEPGSVFKIVTSSIALEENLIDTDDSYEFSCPGYHVVSGETIRCWNPAGHGVQNLREALCNSCNPAFMQLAEKIGAKTFYKYFDAFGFDASHSNNFWNLEDVGPLELATLSFGQRFKITPLQMISAISCIANDGILVKPRIVKQITNPDTGNVTTISPVEIRQVISKDTSEKVLSMMESVVSSGYGKVVGYSIAGKTGTSEPAPGMESEGYVASFGAIAPVESPQVALLVCLYNPTGDSHFGGPVAGPVVSQILTEVLPYLQIPSNSSTTAIDNSSYQTKTLPNVVNKTIAEAKKIIESQGFDCDYSGESDEIVVEQMPKAGTPLLEDSVVKIYSAGNETKISQSVPNLKGMSLYESKQILKNSNLNIHFSGSGIVLSQDPPADTQVEEGSVIIVTLQPETENSH